MGQRLQRLRQAKGLSQTQLARSAQVPVGTLRNWEQNRRVPRLDTAAVVARVLGVTLDELAGDYVKQPEKEATGTKRKRGKFKSSSN
jgi:transcriptional regulator with XRE-family HTH domain